jgi:hypothetical protein
VEIPFLLGRPITAWASIITGVVALSLLIIAILQMGRRISFPVSHKTVGYIAMGIIFFHAIIGLFARFILGI